MARSAGQKPFGTLWCLAGERCGLRRDSLIPRYDDLAPVLRHPGQPAADLVFHPEFARQLPT